MNYGMILNLKKQIDKKFLFIFFKESDKKNFVLDKACILEYVC